MTRDRSLILVIALVFGSIRADPAEPVPAEERASPQTSEAGSEEEGSESAADSKGSDVGARVDPHPIFVPPQRGAPEMIVGGGTRGSGMGELPGITAIVPGQVGFTLESRPTLYWFLSEAVDRQAEIIVVLAESEEPLLETVIPGPPPSTVSASNPSD